MGNGHAYHRAYASDYSWKIVIIVITYYLRVQNIIPDLNLKFRLSLVRFSRFVQFGWTIVVWLYFYR